jgi:spermidine/putrescine transport system permease protein
MAMSGKLLVWTWLSVVLLFIYAPILVMISMAFNESSLYELPFKFTLVWFAKLSRNHVLLDASRNSLLIAAANAVVATALGTMAALALARYQFRGKSVLRMLLYVPVAIPWLILATAILVFFFWTGIGRGLHAILLSHVALSLPYVVVIVGARLASFGVEFEEAAATLGASPGQAFWRVSAPMMAPGILAAALFAFSISFDQFVTSYFLSAPGTTTLPVMLYTAIRKGFTPEINAISALIIIVSMILLITVARFYRFGGRSAQ